MAQKARAARAQIPKKGLGLGRAWNYAYDANGTLYVRADSNLTHPAD